MATVDKNFRIKNGLVVEGSVATLNGNNILSEQAGDSYILNLVGGATLVKSVGTNLSVDNAGQLSLDLAGISSNIAGTRLYANGSSINVDVEGVADDLIGSFGIATTTNVNNAISTAATDATNKANSAEQNAKSYADGLASNYDAAGSATTAENNAKSYADGLAGNYDPAGAANTALQSAEGYADQAAGQALLDAENYTDTAITNLNLGSTYDPYGAASSAASQALTDSKAYTDQEVAALVDSAPALLDTLNELAAAIADNPNYASDVANLVATKADTTYVNSEISDLNTAAQGYATTAENNAKSYADGLAGNYDAAGSASTAQTNAQNYADGLASNYDAAGTAATAQGNAESYADGLVNNLVAGSTAFTELNVAGYTRQVGSWAQAATAGTQIAAYAYSSGWGSAEFLVRVMSNTSGHQHSQLSKLLVTRDGAGNVAITEYGIVTTNGNMGDITADVSGGNIRILVTPTYASSEVIISGTLLAYND
jgi:hypothetical protein